MSESIALDAIAIAALRKCDRVSFHKTDSGSFIQAIKKCKPSVSDPYAPDERTVNIPVDCRLTNYEGKSLYGDRPGYTAFAMLYNYEHSDSEWATIASLLHVGDILLLDWQCGALSSPALVEAGYVGDCLKLLIKRGVGDKRKTLVFHLDEYFGRNERGRMIQVKSATYALT